MASKKTQQKKKKQPAKVAVVGKSGQSSGPAMTAPVAVSRQLTNTGPVIIKAGNGELIVEHTEMLDDGVESASAFTINDYLINPGLFDRFPWLWPIASRYETYKFERLDVSYQPACGTDQTGTVCIGFDFNINDSAPTSLTELYSFQGSTRCAPWMAAVAHAPQRGLNHRTQFYTRTTTNQGRTSLSTNSEELYDTCRIYCARDGNIANATVGQLFMHYRIRLMTPQLNSGDGTLNNTQFWRFVSNTDTGLLSGQGIWSRTGLITGTAWSDRWIAQLPFEGVVTFFITGTGLGVINATGSTATFSNIDTTIQGTTGFSVVYSVSANIGDTFVFNIANTTLSSVVAVFSAITT